MKLVDVAHCRAGDKGNDSILALIPYSIADFEPLRIALDEQVISRHFSIAVSGQISIVELPFLSAIVITIRDVLGGGVTRSTGSDPHGKTLSSHLLALTIDMPPDRRFTQRTV